MDKCPNTKRIDRVEKILYGNGQSGLLEVVTRLDENVKTLVQTDEKLGTSVSALVKFMSEVQGEEKEKKNFKVKTRWLVGIFITVLLAFIGTIITLLTIKP